MWLKTNNLLWIIASAVACCSFLSAESFIEEEEVVTTYTPADNGAGPLWCYGSTVIARIENNVYLSIIETGKDIPPLCNTRWQLWHRSDKQSWETIFHEQQYKQREPCPIGLFQTGAVFLSVNPSTEPPGTKYGRCQPQIIEFNSTDPRKTFRIHEPIWAEGTHFTDHSYRGFAADGKNNELLLLNINAGTGEQFASYKDNTGKWHQKDKIRFPIRACYPQVALVNKAAHVLAIGDIVEPNEQWRKLKFEKLKRNWDYVFRRLFYTYTPDIEQTPFSEPVEIDSVEKTGGHITNLDLYIDESGNTHILYLKRPHQYSFIRDKYFPGRPMTVHLEYMIIKDGKVLTHTSLCETPTQNQEGLEPSYARFHIDSGKNLYVIAAGTMKHAQKNSFGNFMVKIDEKKSQLEFEKLSLQHPFQVFFTNTPRGGSRPSDIIDLFGIAEDNPNLRYARIRLESGTQSRTRQNDKQLKIDKSQPPKKPLFSGMPG